jgi:hypothetical protein
MHKTQAGNAAADFGIQVVGYPQSHIAKQKAT